eukprot:jgi/Botrbrau1/4403/Bobra.105_2s0045.1
MLFLQSFVVLSLLLPFFARYMLEEEVEEEEVYLRPCSCVRFASFAPLQITLLESYMPRIRVGGPIT